MQEQKDPMRPALEDAYRELENARGVAGLRMRRDRARNVPTVAPIEVDARKQTTERGAPLARSVGATRAAARLALCSLLFGCNLGACVVMPANFGPLPHDSYASIDRNGQPLSALEIAREYDKSSGQEACTSLFGGLSFVALLEVAAGDGARAVMREPTGSDCTTEPGRVEGSVFVLRVSCPAAAGGTDSVADVRLELKSKGIRIETFLYQAPTDPDRLRMGMFRELRSRLIRLQIMAAACSGEG